MSTILKALKTLETESDKSSKIFGGAAVGRGTAVPLASNRRYYGRWFYARYCSWLGGLLLLAAGIGIGLYLWQDAFSNKTKTANRSIEAADTIDLSRQSPKPAVGQPMAAVHATTQPEPGSHSDLRPQSQSVRRQVQRPQQTNPEQKKADDPSPAKENFPGSESSAVKEDALPLFKDTGLEVQALSWDPNPQSRIAVINSRLCREGDRIGSYRIETISPDYVVVARGSNRGRLVITRH